MPVSVELYYNPWCTACGNTDAAHGDEKIRWIDATRHLEAAAGLRITRLPALVMNGKLVAQGPRALECLRAWATDKGDLR
ncbi:MAG: hypothetical protein EPN36_16845 [Rhodanobacteraceae bacterium]|nr:MAG: hypothetical protein EPN36_16845 [Rhodanobacteraceae bacterium]